MGAGAEAVSHIPFGDVVAFAQVIDVSIDDAVYVGERVRVVREAFLRVRPAYGWGDDTQANEGRRPAEAAKDLALEDLIEFGFCVS